MFAANILFLHTNYIAEQNCKLPIFDINCWIFYLDNKKWMPNSIPRIDIG